MSWASHVHSYWSKKLSKWPRETETTLCAPDVTKEKCILEVEMDHCLPASLWWMYIYRGIFKPHCWIPQWKSLSQKKYMNNWERSNLKPLKNGKIHQKKKMKLLLLLLYSLLEHCGGFILFAVNSTTPCGGIFCTQRRAFVGWRVILFGCCLYTSYTDQIFYISDQTL